MYSRVPMRDLFWYNYADMYSCMSRHIVIMGADMCYVQIPALKAAPMVLGICDACVSSSTEKVWQYSNPNRASLVMNDNLAGEKAN